LLDVGANADCKPDVLYQFGILGSLMMKHMYGIADPRVGLLSVGEEKEKGNCNNRSSPAHGGVCSLPFYWECGRPRFSFLIRLMSLSVKDSRAMCLENI